MSLYDEYYYSNNCGSDYTRENFCKFFNAIADRIVKDINPRTVLDAGCAKGFLVEALRDRGVEAYGIDISEYAIGEVREDIKAYCKVGSILEPLEMSYDLIISIEVLEHLMPEDGIKALENLCKYTNDFIFTSSPTDYEEASHLNVRPTEYWTNIFAQYGLFRDINYIPDYIVSHAIRFRKNKKDIYDTICDYEREFYRYSIENKTLRKALMETREKLDRFASENIDKEIKELTHTLELIYNSKEWKVLSFYRKLKCKIINPVKKVVVLSKKSITIIKNHGFKYFIKKASNKIRRKLRGLDDYRTWIANNEPNIAETNKQSLINFEKHPKISIIVPLFNTPLKLLDELLVSVVNQSYSNWELCLADGGTENTQNQEIIKNNQKMYPNIKYNFLNGNKGIAGNTMQAVEMATGDYISLVDHDDTLAPFALYEIVKAINEHENADFIYSDEDKLTFNGKKRLEPHFKPNFSPDTLRSYNYITHLTIMSRELFDKAGGFREGFDGSQDYDLILRATELAKGIIHIPKVLYHWRLGANSTAENPYSKMYAYESAKKALAEHLARVGLKGNVYDSIVLGTYKICYEIENKPLISIIIPNKDNGEDLLKCINSILEKSSYINYEFIIVENNSKIKETFELYERFKENPKITILNWNNPFNYSKINNYAEKYAKGEVLLFLNNDTEVINEDWLERMLEYAQRADVGVVGAKLYYPDNTVQHAGVILGMGGIAAHIHANFNRRDYGYMCRLIAVQNMSAVTAACIMMKKAVFEEVGGFDENYPLVFGDVDLCLKVREKGYLNIWTNYAELYHSESKTRGYENTREKKQRFSKEVEYFKSKWSEQLAKGDPYYNPNFTLEKADYSIRTN